MLDAEFNSESNGTIFTGVYRTKIEFYLKNWFFTSVKSAADALDDLCCCFSRLCWMQNLILNRMVPFLQGVIGKKMGFH